jgi:hypothetical protein
MTDAARLIELIETRFAGNQAAFARAIDRQPAQVNQYIKGRRQLGIEVKLHIEQKLDLSGWFGVLSNTSHATPNIKFSVATSEQTPIARSLQSLDAHLKALAPVLQDSGREVLHKWAIGAATATEAKDALEALALASASIKKKD